MEIDFWERKAEKLLAEQETYYKLHPTKNNLNKVKKAKQMLKETKELNKILKTKTYLYWDWAKEEMKKIGIWEH